MAKTYLFSVFLLLFFSTSLHAQQAQDFASVTDSCSMEIAVAKTVSGEGMLPTAVPPADDYTRFHVRPLVFPAVAVAFGSVSTSRHLFDTSSERSKHEVENAFQYVPVGAYAVLGFVPGVRHAHRFGDRLMAGATAYVLMTAVCQGTKRIVGERRPDSSGHNSFPSGHTATAFCGAELCRMEYGNAYGAAAYAFAVTTGVMRVVNNRHWCNDVLAGAGIGFLAAHAGYWLLPAEKRLVQRLFRRPKEEHAFLLAPSYQYETKAPSLTFSMNF